MELTNENYHSTEARMAYMGYTQFKNFLECPKKALAIAKGEVEEKSTAALLFGSYVDNYFSKEIPMDQFVSQHPEMFTKQGTLKSEFKNVESVIKSIEEDELLMKYLGGEHQVIMTGEIAGVPFKIKIDAYHEGKVIVDQKIMKDMEDVWVDEDHRYEDFIQAWRYDLEGAIYQEIVRQKTGKKLPFVLAVTTKEDVPDKALIRIDQKYLDAALEEVKEKAPIFAAMKRGEIEAPGCGKCEVCRKEKKVTGVFDYSRLFGKDEDEEY